MATGPARRGFHAGLALGFVLLAGCVGIKPYPNDLDKNLHVRTTTDSGWFLWTVRTAVDIHRAKADCSTDYAGTVQLDAASTDIGLPPGEWSRLVFVFATSSFLANSRGTITYDTWLKPRPGHTYQLDVTYEDDLYNVSILEHQPDAPTPRKVPRHTSNACRA